jgi:hypothetical protein
MAKDLGDFQTPIELAAEVVACLAREGRRWTRALEPTCGRGNFIRGLVNSPHSPREIVGLEVQDIHLDTARTIASSSANVSIQKANIFDIDLSRDISWRESGPLLVVGNPPWVTNAALGAMNSANLPRKSNLKNLRGIDALTGSSNFDVAEFIWIKILKELASQHPSIALLSKTSVARNILQFAYDSSLPISNAWLRRIDARKHFRAAVDACLFYVEVEQGEPRYEAAVFADLQSREPETVWCFANGRLVAGDTSQQGAIIDGHCSLVWRQGIKHDAARVMELREDGGALRNRLGEAVEVESDYVYPLLKGGDLFHANTDRPNMHVIIPQRRIGDDTSMLQTRAPRLWDYLSRHANYFDCRKSSIYRGRPQFSIFGVGAYSFAPYKVAVSGFHKQPRFRAVSPTRGRPVMLDDTSYFIPCTSAKQAAELAALLNHPLTLDFIRSAMFMDAKRPITKRLLQRIDLSELSSLLE